MINHDDLIAEEFEAIDPICEPIFGNVTNERRLNIRKAPNIDSEVLYVEKPGAELMIDLNYSTEEWYSVYNNAGVNGFCMKEYVVLK